MVTIILFFLGIFTLTMDIMNGKRGYLALLWNNMRYFVVVQGMCWLIVSFTVIIYQVETITGVISKINNMGTIYEFQMFVITTCFIFIIFALLTALMFKKLKYNDAISETSK